MFSIGVHFISWQSEAVWTHGNQYAVGWLNMLGQVALTASVDSCLANHIAAMWSIYNGHVFSQEELLLCYTGKGPAMLERRAARAAAPSSCIPASCPAQAKTADHKCRS